MYNFPAFIVFRREILGVFGAIIMDDIRKWNKKNVLY
jgi:hypothetical protein